MCNAFHVWGFDVWEKEGIQPNGLSGTDVEREKESLIGGRESLIERRRRKGELDGEKEGRVPDDSSCCFWMDCKDVDDVTIRALVSDQTGHWSQIRLVTGSS